MSEYETTVERDGEEIPVTVEYTYHRATRGARDSLCGIRGAGPPLEPDEPAWAEIDKVTGPDGSVIDITDSEAEWISDAIMEDIRQSADDDDERDPPEDRDEEEM